MPFCSESGTTSSRSTATAKVALPVGTIPSAIGLPVAAERWSAPDVAQVVDQAHHELGHEHGERRGEHLAGGSAHQCHEQPDHDREGQRLARVHRPEQAPQLSGCLARHLCAHGSQY